MDRPENKGAKPMEFYISFARAALKADDERMGDV